MTDQPELQQVLAEIAAEKERKARRAVKVNWFFFGGLIGFLFGVGFSLIAVDQMLMPTVRANAQALISRQAETKDLAAKLQEAQRVIRLGAARIAEATGYTALLEPAPTQQPSSGLKLFDILSPGLGTVLTKLQAAQAATQSPRVAVYWVIPGHVKALTKSPGYAYCWLDANGEADPQNCPPAGIAQAPEIPNQ